MLENLLRLVKVEMHLMGRMLRDIQRGNYRRFAKQRVTNIEKCFTQVLSIALEIKPGKYIENKMQNLKLICKILNHTIIFPGECFSFWYLVKNPTKKRGFVVSRVLRNDKAIYEIGGGICQISGLIYWLALQLGMEIIERHAHSTDLYNEQTRFTLLGSDATVVFGYKDIRFKNCSTSPVILELNVQDGMLYGRGYSKIGAKYLVEFEEEHFSPEYKKVRTYRSNGMKREIISEDIYKVSGDNL